MKVVIEPEIETHDPALYQSDKIADHRYAGWENLAENYLDQYDQRGYLIVDGGLTPNQVHAARQTLNDMAHADDPKCEDIFYEGLIRQHMQNANAIHEETDEDVALEALALGDISKQLPNVPADIRAKYVRKFSYFCDNHPALHAIATHPKLIEAVETLMGEPAKLFQDMAMIKPPNGREKPWHQDHAYFNLPLDTRIVGVWIALDRVTPENGCMFMLPGAHKDGPHAHFMRRDWQICDTEMQGIQSTCAPMEAGDILVFDAKLPHGTPTNRGNDYRWAIQLHYIPQSAFEVGDQVRLDAFGHEGKNVSC
ncbi:phytanoyl-CoA dioxygenase family protein [Poriferisphaera sp. WC338]|uniref:phytanoyl-CoA dioxygenase family protein n=1 Tax=Poriferisphaera sp. WC338 TaxID=3425129 RepID=UPI003D81A768